MWLVDSSVWIDFFNGKATPATNLLDSKVGRQELALGDIILCEVLQGFRSDKEFQQAQAALLHFPVFDMGGRDIAIKSALNYRQLRKQGVTIRKTIDCLIATFAIERGLLLLHDDRDFEPFAQHLNLQVVRS